MGCDRLWLALVALTCGCALSLDETDASPLRADSGVPAPPTCVPFREPGIVGATGRVRSYPAPAGGGALRFAVDALELDSGAVAPAVFDGVDPGATGCLARVPDPAPATPALDLAPLGGGLGGSLLDTFEVAGQRYAYVATTAGFDPVGVAIASWDEVAGRFVVAPEHLFTSDRPAYGDAVIVDGDVVYAYGCAGSGFLTDSCYLARVAADRLGDRTAYEFYRGGGPGNDFVASIDEAWPLFEGGGGLAVVARADRVYVAYVTPLGETVTLRSGLGPSGPFSAPLAAARCELPAGGFCRGLSAHPALDAADPGALTLTYANSSFEPLTAEQRATRMVQVRLDALP